MNAFDKFFELTDKILQKISEAKSNLAEEMKAVENELKKLEEYK